MAFDVAQHPTRDEDVVAVVACDRSIFTEPILCFVFVVVLLNTGSLFAHSLRRALGAIAHISTFWLVRAWENIVHLHKPDE